MKGTIWCLHGAVGSAADWQGLSIDGWAIKRVDLWRFLACCPMTMKEFGRALNREAVATEGRKVLLGYSMGGRLGLQALLEGGAWSAGVIVSAHPGLEGEAERVARREKDAEWAALALKGEWSDFLDQWNGQGVLGTSNIERRTSNAEMKMVDRAGLVGRRKEIARSFVDWSLGAQDALCSDLRRMECPLLWMAGEKDEKFRELAKRAVGEEATILPETGHRLPWEAPELFAAQVGEFLERLDS